MTMLWDHQKLPRPSTAESRIFSSTIKNLPHRRIVQRLMLLERLEMREREDLDLHMHITLSTAIFRDEDARRQTCDLR